MPELLAPILLGGWGRRADRECHNHEQGLSNACDGSAPAENKGRSRASERPKSRAFKKLFTFAQILVASTLSFDGEWGHGMKVQETKLQASENDLKRLMADVTRAMEKAQEAITRIAPNLVVTATETKRAQC